MEPVERVIFFGDNDDEDESYEFVVNGGDIEDVDDNWGYREEFIGVLNDPDNEPLLSSNDNGCGGVDDDNDEFKSWCELLRNNEGFVDVGEVDLFLCDIGKFLRLVREFCRISDDWVGVALSLKSISLNLSNIILQIS